MTKKAGPHGPDEGRGGRGEPLKTNGPTTHTLLGIINPEDGLRILVPDVEVQSVRQLARQGTLTQGRKVRAKTTKITK